MKKQEIIDTASWFCLNISCSAFSKKSCKTFTQSENLILSNALTLGNILFKYRPVSTSESPLDFVFHHTATALDTNKKCVVRKV